VFAVSLMTNHPVVAFAAVITEQAARIEELSAANVALTAKLAKLEHLDALADPETLLVFASIAVTTTTANKPPQPQNNTISTHYITPFGLQRNTKLSRDEVERAATRLKHAGLLDTLPDHERGYENWRVDEDALAAAATTSRPNN
jgi:hypothetical protein